MRFVAPFAQLIAVLLAVAAATFFIQAALPGDPAEARIGPRPDLSYEQREDLVRAIRHEYGLDRPLSVQFAKWLGKASLLDFGETESGVSVRSTVVARLGPTIELALMTILVSVPIALVLALATAPPHRRMLARVTNTVLIAGFVTPLFWLGILLVLLFAVWLHVLPASGYVAFSADPLGHVRVLILPVMTLTVLYVALWYRYLQQGLRDALRTQYVRTARAKGLSERTVLYRHALPNALLPMVTILGLTVGTLIGGIVVVERVFSWPGVGSLLLYSVDRFDYNTLEAIVLAIAVVYVVFSTLTDIAYRVIDPRIRRS